jgi:hypothetical protein
MTPGHNDSKKLTPLLSDSEIFTYKSQHMDYFDAQGVTLNTGYTNKLEWYLLPIRELLDNACDFLQKNYKDSKDTTITVNIHAKKELFHLTVTNTNKNDIPVFSNLDPIFDFEKRYGSKQDVHVISRGMLGDALKQILSLGYTLLHVKDEGTDFSDKQWDHPLIIRHNGRETRVYLKVDKARQQARAISESDKNKKLNHTDTETAMDYPPSCYYCEECFDGIGKQGYEKHVLKVHPKKPCYPGLADIEKHSLVAKGMWWEI